VVRKDMWIKTSAEMLFLHRVTAGGTDGLMRMRFTVYYAISDQMSQGFEV